MKCNILKMEALAPGLILTAGCQSIEKSSGSAPLTTPPTKKTQAAMTPR